MKKLFILLLAMCALGASQPVAAQKFVLVDMEYILKNIPAFERANEQLNQISRKWQAEVEALNAEAKQLYKTYQAEAVFLSAEQKQEREGNIVAKEKEAAELKKKYFGPQGELFYRASEKEEESLVVELDLERSENVRRWWPFLRDRRIDEYTEITKRFID